MSTLAVEERTFEAHKQALLREAAGQFVLIKGTDVIGVFPTRNAAMSKGYENFGNAPFMMRQIVEFEEPIFNSFEFRGITVIDGA